MSKRHQLHIQDSSGHSTLTWPAEATDEDLEVKAASDAFSRMTGQGYMGYKVMGPDKGEGIATFDKEAEETILSPPLRGG